jgi:hypothetical protein
LSCLIYDPVFEDQLSIVAPGVVTST